MKKIQTKGAGPLNMLKNGREIHGNSFYHPPPSSDNVATL